MKWGLVEPQRGQFDWKGADALVAFAKANGQKIRGHTLVWHSQLPLWLINGAFQPNELKDLMVAHIAAEAGRYKGAIYAWDVVNEPFTDDGCWRKSILYDAMGPDYVATALKAARAADPAAKLYVNDYNVETDGPKMRALYDLVASLKRAGAPIDGVGLQSHFVAGAAPADIQSVMEKFAGARGRRRRSPNSTSASACPPTKKRLRRRPATTHPSSAPAGRRRAASGVTTWGITDDHSWIPSFFSGYGAALPFDEAYRPKPARRAMIKAFTQAAP